MGSAKAVSLANNINRKMYSVEHFSVFGTDCSIQVSKEKRRKFDKKSMNGSLVSYIGNRDGYRIWVPGCHLRDPKAAVEKDREIGRKYSNQITLMHLLCFPKDMT